MNDTEIDLLVIGAGATGASIAYEATKRGMSVALVDAGDLGGSTSCRSSKLLHGGVRYLELAVKTLDIAQLKLVREALIERRYWLEQAPFLAKQIELALPTADYCSKAYYRLGLGAYDALSGNTSIGKSRFLSKKELYNALPRLENQLNGGVAYSDGQFDDARLNLLLALTAKREGAIIRSYCKVIKLEHKLNGKICGAITKDKVGKLERWSAKVVVNATGIYADTIRQMADHNIEPRMLTSRGVHIVLEENLCPENIGVLLPSTDDGRVLFLLPFFGQTQVGTTDVPCSSNKAFAPSDEEKNYLISYVQRWFPELKKPIIKSSWAGGRPLLRPNDTATNSSRVVREHQVETLSCGLISIMGGKWTTCRPMALDTLKAVGDELGVNLPSPKPIALVGASRDPSQTPIKLLAQQEKLKEYLPTGPLLNKQIAHLQASYGLEALRFISNSPIDQRNPLSEIIPICEAQISRSIKEEHACTPTDVLARRCRLAMVDLAEAKRILPIVQKHLVQGKLPVGDLNLEK